MSLLVIIVHFHGSRVLCCVNIPPCILWMGYFQFLDVANVMDIPVHVFWYIYVCINVVYIPKNGMTGS